MTENEIKTKVIDVVDVMDVFEKFRLWNEYQMMLMSCDVRLENNNSLLGVFICVAEHPFTIPSFEDFISESNKAKKCYETGMYYNLTGIYSWYKNKHVC